MRFNRVNHELRLSKRELLILLGLLLITGIGFGLHWSFTIDDAAISFSYARHFAAGHGLGALFPGAPRVEGYSNLLWVIFLAAGSKLGFDTVLVSKLLGLVFSLGIVTILFLSLRKFVVQSWLLAGLVLLPISLTFSFWSTSGLENSLYAFLILLSIYFLINEEIHPTGRVPLGSALTLILVGMTRPEGLLYVLAGLSYKILQLILNWKAKDTRQTQIIRVAAWLGVLILGYGLFKAWHYWYFAAWWPNPIYAKAGWYRLDLGRVWFEPAGWVYLRGFFRTFGGIWMIPALVFGGLVSLKGAQRVYPIFALAALALPLYTPDWMINYRFLYPFLPLAAALLVLAADQLWTWIFYSKGDAVDAHTQQRLVQVGAILLAVFFGFGVAYYAWANLRLTQRQLACGYTVLAETRCLDGRMYWTMGEVDQKYAELADIADQLGLSEPLYMFPDIGATSYLQNKRILDLAGLGDYQMARIREGNLLKQYVFQERRPDIVMTYGIWTRRTDLTTFQAFQDGYIAVEKGTDENGLVHGTFVRKDLLVETGAVSADAKLCELAKGLFLVQLATNSSTTIDVGAGGQVGLPLHGLDTFWIANTPQADDWNLEINLLDSKGVQVYQWTGPLGYGWYPASEWQLGEQFRQHVSLPADLAAGDYTLQVRLDDATGSPGAQTGCEIAVNIPDAQTIQQNISGRVEALHADAQAAWGEGDLDGMLASIQQSIELNRMNGLPTEADGGAEWRSFARRLYKSAGESAKQADWQRAYKLYLAAALVNPENAWAQHGLEIARRKFLLGSEGASIGAPQHMPEYASPMNYA